MPLIPSSGLTSLVSTSSAMLNRSGEREHPSLVLVLKRNAFGFCLFSMMSAVGLSYMALIILRFFQSLCG